MCLLNENNNYMLSSTSIIICCYIDTKSLCNLSCLSKDYSLLFCSEILWKHRCLDKFPELKQIKNFESDKSFPIYKNCYLKKMSEMTTLKHLQTLFRKCDWFTCPNGHLYAIGECRIPVQVGKCPECGAKVGGKYHRMLNTNNHLGKINNINQSKINGNIDFKNVINFKKTKRKMKIINVKELNKFKNIKKNKNTNRKKRVKGAKIDEKLILKKLLLTTINEEESLSEEDNNPDFGASMFGNNSDSD